jgi:PAS domain S-box-containing protein
MGRGDRTMRDGRPKWLPYLIPGAILSIGVLSAFLLFWILRMNDDQREDFKYVDALMDIQVRMATFHLWFEEAIADGNEEKKKRSLENLDAAQQLIHALRHGGKSEHGVPLPPLETAGDRMQVEKLVLMMSELQDLAAQRSRDPEGGKIGTPLDERFNAVFLEHQKTTRALEALAERNAAEDHRMATRLIYAVSLIWMTAIAAMALLFFKRELRRYRAEDTLRRSEKDLARAQAVAHTGSWRLDPRTNELSWSDETYRIFGIPKGTPLTYETFLVLVPPDDREHVDRAWTAAFRGMHCDVEHRIVAGGDEKWVRARGEPEFDARGTLRGAFGTIQDITERSREKLALERAYGELEQRVLTRTAELQEANRQLREEIDERKRAELSLSMSEGEFRSLSTQFRTLLDTIPDSITLVAPDLRVMWANKGAAVASPSHSRGRRCYELWHDRSTPCGDCPALRSFLSGRMESSRITSPDGRHWDIRTVPVVKEGGALEGVIEVASDVTEQVNLQAETMRAAHLASLGELAAGVAHEINNPVNGILACAEILVNKSDEGSRAHEISGRIIREGNRIAFIVKSLLSFAREETEEKMPSYVQDILADSIAMADAQLRKEGITLILDVPLDIPPVLAQPQQLVQVFLNLIHNARYALSQKYPGKHEEKVLGITVREATVDARARVRIAFRDRGTGIPESMINRVLTPFFSTKPKGMGTGLGLSISHGIVVHHGGTLMIDSVEGEFTEVVIELPLSEKR